MGSGDLALSVQDSGTCAGCTIVLGDNISSTSTLTRKMFPTQQKMWDPSDDPNDFNGSQMVNRKTHGGLTKFFLFPSIPFALNLSVTIKASGATLPLASGNMTHMSVYHPFPLRIEGQQYDACFQIGEFGARNKHRMAPPLQHIVFDLGPLVIGTGVVVLIPLASGVNILGPGARFVNSFAGLMTGAANGVSVPSLKIADILDVSRPFYTWKNADGTRVIVMAEPVIISDSNMRSIQMSTPATPPADAIHEIQPAQYKPVAPPPRPPVRIFQPPVDLSIIGEGKKNVILDVLKTVGSMVAVFIVIWLAIRFAKSETGKNIIDGIGIGLSRLYRGLGGAAAGAGSAARAAAGAAGQGIRSGVGAAGSAIGSAASAAGSAASAAGSAIGSAASAAGQGIRSGAAAAGSAIGSAGQGIRSVAARGLGVGSAPSSQPLPTADAMKARRATRDAANNGFTTQYQNPALTGPLARKAAAERRAAANPAAPKPAAPKPAAPSGNLTLRRPAAAPAAKPAAPAAKPRRIVVPEPEDGKEDTTGEAEQAEEEFERKAAATRLPRRRATFELDELKRQGARIAEKGFGGKRRRRRHRHKTGRKV